MSKSDLTILTVVENDPGLLELMLKSVHRFTDPAPNLIICDNSNGKNTSRLLSATNDWFESVKIIRNQPTLKSGSIRHGEGLNKIFPLVETPKTAIIESDCVLLRPGWDYIDFNQHKMIAAKKGELAGQPFYHICFLLFSTRIMKHGNIIDFRPGKDSNRTNRNFKWHEDVGWRVREKVRPDQVGYMDFVDCKTGKGFFFDSSFQSDELWYGGQPLVSHFGRGSCLDGKAIRKGFKHPKEQLKKWKKIAEKIIDGG